MTEIKYYSINDVKVGEWFSMIEPDGKISTFIKTPPIRISDGRYDELLCNCVNLNTGTPTYLTEHAKCRKYMY